MGDQGLDFGQCVQAGAIIGGGGQRRLHSGQVGGGDTADAQGLELGQADGRARCGGHHGRSGMGQGLKFSHGVHVGGAQPADQLAQQAGCGVGAVAAQARHAQGRVVRSGGDRVAVGIDCGEHGGVGVDHGLQVDCRAGGAGGQAGQCAVDGAEVGAAHASDASGAVVAGLRFGVGACVAAEGEGGSGFVHQGLEFGQAVCAAAVVGGGG